MSLLEDVFLQDEANEAAELERVIEGDEFEERRRSDSDENSEKEDEAEEDKRRVDPTKNKITRVVKNPRILLNPARLTGPRGIQVIPDHFKDFKFKGKGYEKEDLDLVLKRLEHWAYRLYPKFQFDDCLKKIETLGKKRPVAVHLHKIRSDQFLSEDTVVQKDSSDEDTPMPVQEEDEFDKLLQQQIDLARSTPVPNSAKKPDRNGSISPRDERLTSLMMPKATSSPSINEEQRERMLRSRRLAEERRLARLKNDANIDSAKVNSDSRLVNTDLTKNLTDHNVEIRESNIELNEKICKDIGDEMTISKKHSRSNIIDSSDEESAVETYVSVAVDVHNSNKITDENDVIENNKSVSNIINVNSHSDAEEAQETENKTESGKNTLLKSNLEISDGNELIVGIKDIVENENGNTENNISHVNDGPDNLNATDNIEENSDENLQLRYDDSDINIDLNEPNVSVGNNENSINGKKDCDAEEKETILHDTDITNGEKDAVCSAEGIKNFRNEKSSVPIQIVQEMEKERDNIEILPEEIVEDIMDVDFTDDF